MNVNSIFLDPKSLEETNNNYGIVRGSYTGTINNPFTEQYLNKWMLVQELQLRLNNIGSSLVDLPEETDKLPLSIEYRTIKNILDQVRAL